MRAGIVYREGSAEAKELATRVARWFREREVAVRSLDTQEPLPDCEVCPEGAWAEGLKLAVVIGGDGTLLRAAQMISSPEVLVVGVKLGGLGFLTEVRPDEVYNVLAAALAGRAPCMERMTIEAVIRNGTVETPFHALNEVAITCAGMPRVTDLNTAIDGVFLNSFRADGLLVSTPTGSTAYTMAAGGPIVHPAMRCLTITQIAPHTLTSRPLVIPATATVTVSLARQTHAVHVNADSQHDWPFTLGQSLEIRAAARGLALAISPSMSYYEILRTKLRWGER
jgi:NAD+ kinase